MYCKTLSDNAKTEWLAIKTYKITACCVRN